MKHCLADKPQKAVDTGPELREGGERLVAVRPEVGHVSQDVSKT